MFVNTEIKVVGVGGGGGNTVNNVISSGLEGVDFIVADTNARGLEEQEYAKYGIKSLTLTIS